MFSMLNASDEHLISYLFKLTLVALAAYLSIAAIVL